MRVVEPDVEAPEALARTRLRGVDRRGVVHVDPHREDRVAVTGGQLGQRRGVARGGRDLVAAGEGVLRPDPAEPLRRPGDEEDFVWHERPFAARISMKWRLPPFPEAQIST